MNDRSFEVTATAPNTSLDSSNTGQATFTVRNTSVNALKGRLGVKAQPPAEDAWFTIAGDTTCEFAPDAVETVTVTIEVPPGTEAGSYAFQLNAWDEARSDVDFTEGQSVHFEVHPTEKPKKPFPWWILAVAAIVLVGIVVSVWLVSCGDEKEPAVSLELVTDANDGLINDPTPTFRGTASTDEGDANVVEIEVREADAPDGEPVRTVTANSDDAGAYEASVENPLESGTYRAVATQSDEAGNTGRSDPVEFTVNLEAPKLTIEPVTDANDGFTNDPTPTFRGTASTDEGDANVVEIEVREAGAPDGEPIRTVTANSGDDGAYEASVGDPLASGTYRAVATQGDEAGNTGRSDPVEFTVDLEAPKLTIVSPRNGQRFRMSASETKFSVSIRGKAGGNAGDANVVTLRVSRGRSRLISGRVRIRTDGTWSKTVSLRGNRLGTNGYNVFIRQRDKAGNRETDSVNFSVIRTLGFP